MLDNNTEIIAWGKSKLLELFIKNAEQYKIRYIIDSDRKLAGSEFNGIKIMPPDVLDKEQKDNIPIVIFAVSSLSVQAILKACNSYGFLFNKQVFLYSDLFFRSFADKLYNTLGLVPSVDDYRLIKSFSITSRIPVQTTILGNMLFLELLKKLDKNIKQYSIAEVGAYNGGNALLAQQFMIQRGVKPYYIIDSFEGFPETTAHDPAHAKKGVLRIDCSYESILDIFSVYDNVKVLKGFVPDILSTLDKNEKYGLVFYDCDLYQPALDTYAYFWEKIIPSGFMLIHDYITEEGGYMGVKKATLEFFNHRNAVIHEFWHNTMALVIKQ